MRIWSSELLSNVNETSTVFKGEQRTDSRCERISDSNADMVISCVTRSHQDYDCDVRVSLSSACMPLMGSLGPMTFFVCTHRTGWTIDSSYHDVPC